MAIAVCLNQQELPPYRTILVQIPSAQEDMMANEKGTANLSILVCSFDFSSLLPSLLAHPSTNRSACVSASYVVDLQPFRRR